MRRPTQAVRLAPGEQSRVLALDAPSAPEPANVGAALAWTGTVFASGDTAGSLASLLSRLFDVPVTVSPALAAEGVSDGEYGADGLRDALDKLAATLGARVEADGDGFRVVE